MFESSYSCEMTNLCSYMTWTNDPRDCHASDGESMCIAIAQASSRDQIAFNPDFFPGLLCTKTTQVSHLIAKISPGIDGFESYMFYFQRKKNIKKEVIWATFLLTSVINRENKSSTSSFAELGVPAILKFEPVLLEKKRGLKFCFVRRKYMSVSPQFVTESDLLHMSKFTRPAQAYKNVS